MGLIVGLTGASGLLFSFLMWQAGIASMALRYPLAILMAYGIFLFLLWLWLRTKAEDYTDIQNFTDLMPRPGSGNYSVPYQGGGGNYGGGGASGSFEDSTTLNIIDADTSTPLDSAVSAVGDADELAIPIIAIIFVIGLALASFYVVYVAPILFAELLVDGVLSYALYRKIRGVETQHWLVSAVRQTAIPFLLTGIFVGIVGVMLSVYAPEAQTFGQAIHQTNHGY